MIGSFFWISAIYFYCKYTMKLSDSSNWLFFAIVVAFMYFANLAVIQSKCSSPMPVFRATFLPWFLMFAPVLLALMMFPSWKTPFSNTFGYLVARIAGGNQALLDLLVPNQPLQYVYEDPSLLLNQFTTTNFETMFQSMKEVMVDDAVKKEALLQVVRLKEIISEWIWFLLGASVAISSSYTILMNTECTKSAEEYVLKHNIAMAETEEKVAPTLYTITD
uniref:Uncharacterized protein n=1 Tax=viral metagenome TaxID=1070528 RepID=A0A6C0HZQ9_9ZZZZ